MSSHAGAASMGFVVRWDYSTRALAKGQTCLGRVELSGERNSNEGQMNQGAERKGGEPGT